MGEIVRIIIGVTGGIDVISVFNLYMIFYFAESRENKVSTISANTLKIVDDYMPEILRYL